MSSIKDFELAQRIHIATVTLQAEIVTLRNAAVLATELAEKAESRIAALESERDALKDELRQANGVRDVFASAVVAQAMQEVDKMPNPQESPVDKSTGLQGSDPNGVICPQCVTQFHAVPVNVQERIAALRHVVAAADAMRDMGVSIGQQVVHPEGMPDDRALYEFIGLFDGPFQRDYDAARAALKEPK